jgi:hypothetical protein
MHVQFDGAHAEPQLLRGFGAAGELTIADKPKQKIAPPRETTNRSIGLS